MAKPHKRRHPRPPHDPLFDQADLETQVRYGPEERALDTLDAEAARDLRFQVKSARGTSQGIAAAVDAARPQTSKIYTDARRSLADIGSDVAATGGLQGVVAQVAAREQAGAERRVEESRAADLSGLQQRKVGAAEGGLYAVQNATQHFRETSQDIGQKRLGLAGDEAAFKLSTVHDLQDKQHQLRMEQARLRLSRQSEARQQRQTEASITGIDPLTGLPTATERARAGKKRFTQDQRSKHQGIVGEIQDARQLAAQQRKLGGTWENIATNLSAPRRESTSDHPANPYGGHGPLVTRAAVELARHGKVSHATLAALKARGFLPALAPKGWKSNRPVQRSTVDSAFGSVGDLF